MEVINLNNYELSELSHDELNETSGGWWPIAAAALTIAILNTDWDQAHDDFCRGYNGG